MDRLRTDHEHERQWMRAFWGTVYTIVGVTGLYSARHVGNPWHLLLNVLGVLLTVVGGGCLAWFIGLASILGLEQVDDTRPIERACLLFAAVIGCWAVYLLVRI